MRRTCGHLLLALLVSLLLLGLLARSVPGEGALPFFSRLLVTLQHLALPLVAVYVGASLLRSLLQTGRYRLLLEHSGPERPGFLPVFLVTMSRNMFIDLLPARLGELSFVAMLNRGCRVSAAACLSALAIAFLFDLLALALILVVLLGWQLVQLRPQWWLIAVIPLLLLLVLAGFAALFPGLRGCEALLRRWSGGRSWPLLRKLGDRAAAFVSALIQALQQARAAGISGRLLAYSLAVRLAKYLGLYSLFCAVAMPQFPEVDTALTPVLMALVSGEAAAALPVPAFMGFGVYEGGGMLALSALGASRSAALAIMLGLHLFSQAVDYGLGCAALVLFAVLGSGRAAARGASDPGRRKRRLLFALLLLMLGLAAALVSVRELRHWQRRQAMAPPTSFGETLPGDSVQPGQVAQILQGRRGFLVWSSNRSGNHALWRLDLPEGRLSRLTDGRHAATFPRIAPDGRRVLFARSKTRWNSQRDHLAWDVYLLDLQSGAERLLARDGNAPTWSADGNSVFFQRQGRQMLRLDLASGREQLLLASGGNLAVPQDTWLETPSLSPDGRRVAVTLRGARRATAVVDLADGALHPVGDGCQLAWSPDGSYLFKVDHGGRQQNAFYRLDARTLAPLKWLDLPGEFSHEYFPRVAGSGDLLVFAASRGDHEHDKADYEIFLWQIGRPPAEALRLTFHSGNDNWPDLYLYPEP